MFAIFQRIVFPVLQATIQQYRTVLSYPGDVAYSDKKTGQLRDPDDLYTWKIGGEYTNGTNILGLVFFAGKAGSIEASDQFFYDNLFSNSWNHPCPDGGARETPARLFHLPVGSHDDHHHVGHLPRADRSLLPYQRTGKGEQKTPVARKRRRRRRRKSAFTKRAAYFFARHRPLYVPNNQVNLMDKTPTLCGLWLPLKALLKSVCV